MHEEEEGSRIEQSNIGLGGDPGVQAGSSMWADWDQVQPGLRERSISCPITRDLLYRAPTSSLF